MKGDFSRLTRPDKRRDFSTVLLQQGRVLLDSDWNDLVEILERELRVRTRMIIGEDGGPEGDEGFELRFACGVDLNFGGQKDQQYDQSVALKRRPSLPFREVTADLPYTLKLDFIVPESDCCGESPRAVLVSVPGRWTIHVERDLCLVFSGPDDQPLCRLGKVPVARLQTLCVSYDGDQRIRVWSYSPPLRKAPRCDEIECAAWTKPKIPGAPGPALTIAARQPADGNLRCTLAGLWIWDAEIASWSDPGTGDRDTPGCQLVCALDLSAIKPRAELDDAVIIDISGKSNHGRIHLRDDDKSLPPVRLLGVTIGPGDYVVDGLVARSADWTALDQQPWTGRDLPGLQARTDVATLFYLQVWERFVSALQYPQIVEPALGGPDTTARTQTIWQVQSLVADTAAEVEARWQALRTRRERPGRARLFRPATETGNAGNRLYRVEIHSPGWALAPTCELDQSSSITFDRVSSSSITVEDPDIASLLGPGSVVGLWFDLRPTALFQTVVTCVLGEGRFELARLPDTLSGGCRLQPIATFKWSSCNGIVAFPVRSVARKEASLSTSSDPGDAAAPAPTSTSWNFTLDNAGYNGLVIKPGDWLELVNDAHDLARRGGPFFKISAVEVNTLVITAESATADKFDLGSNPVLRRWEVCDVPSSPLVLPTLPGLPPPLKPVRRSALGFDEESDDDPSVTDARLLDQAIYVRFSGEGFYAAGDWWVVPVRDEIGDGLLWPSKHALPPQGIALHEARLATLQLGLGSAKARDLRQKFATLTDLTRDRDASGSGGEGGPPPDVAALITTVLEQVWSGRARILVEGAEDLPGLERTGIRVEGRCLDTEEWQSLDSTDAPSGAGVALLWQYRPVFLGDSASRLDERGAWRPLAAFDKRVDFAACACGSRLWLFGGRDLGSRDSRTISAIKLLDGPQATAWEQLDGVTLDAPAVGLAAVTLAGRIHLIGGVTEDGTQKLHRVFDPKTRTFTRAADLLTARKNFALVLHDGLLYAIGGCDPDGGYLASVECWDPSSDTWYALPPADGEPQLGPLTDLAAVSVPEGLVVVGGLSRAVRVDSWLFRPAVRRWQALAPLAAARSRHGLVATSARAEPDQPAILAIGGVDDRKAVAQIEQLSLSRSFQVLRASQR